MTDGARETVIVVVAVILLARATLNLFYVSMLKLDGDTQMKEVYEATIYVVIAFVILFSATIIDVMR